MSLPKRILTAEEKAQKIVRRERRFTLFYAGLVSGIVALIIGRAFDVTSYNTVVGEQSRSCVVRHDNGKKANRNNSATINMVERVLLPYLLDAAQARHEASLIQRHTDPEQAVINEVAARYWRDTLARRAKHQVKRYEDLTVPDCSSVPNEKDLIPVTLGD